MRDAAISAEPVTPAGIEDASRISLDEKVAFLRSAKSYSSPAGEISEVVCRETHMSWVFLAGQTAYKLKKPVRFSYLDFSTLDRRETACRAELVLNRRLAGDVYQGVVPIVEAPKGLTIGGAGRIVDWLVVMRRLDERATLEHALVTRQLATWQLDRTMAALGAFYRHASRVLISPEAHFLDWHRSLALNRKVLLDQQLGLSPGRVRRIDRVQCRFLAERSCLMASRVHRRQIVDGHGDLRPEHIWLGDPVRIIDCLEFNPRLRAVDPLDEIAFLCIECERLGFAWAAEHLKRRTLRTLPDGGLSDELFTFYRCYRATLRARLAIAHLLEPHPRTPEKWPQLARAYLQIAERDAKRLQRMLKRPASRRGIVRHANVGWCPR